MAEASISRRASSARNAFAGFAKAVAGTAFLIAVGAAAIMVFTSPEGAGFVPFFFVVALLGSVIGVAAAGLVIGLPLTWVLASNRLEGPWTYPPVGFLVGATLVLIFYNLVFAWAPREVIPMFVPLVLVGGLPGGIYGALWWYFHRRHVQGS
jgi:hypothetical protein